MPLRSKFSVQDPNKDMTSYLDEGAEATVQCSSISKFGTWLLLLTELRRREIDSLYDYE